MSIEKQTVELLKSKKLKLATAESCTGGLISKRITDVSGSSDENGGSGVLDLHCQNLFKQLPVRGRAVRLPRRTVRIGLKSKK